MTETASTKTKTKIKNPVATGFGIGVGLFLASIVVSLAIVVFAIVGERYGYRLPIGVDLNGRVTTGKFNGVPGSGYIEGAPRSPAECVARGGIDTGKGCVGFR